MFDPNLIRNDPAAFDAKLARRGAGPIAPEFLALDAEARRLTVAVNDLQAKRNAASKGIGAAKAQGDDETFRKLRAEVENVKKELPALEAQEKDIREKIHALLSGSPNLPAEETPDGVDEADNVEHSRWGEPPEIADAKQHFDLGEALGGMDFETAAKISGSRFVLLRGAIARLERAISNFMLDVHTEEFGYSEISSPALVRSEALFGVGQLPKFEEDLFRTTGEHWLIPTAEATLTNTVRESILDEAALPLRMTAHTPCFRSEAGAAGRDTRGMIRLHQFTKVELVSITTPEASRDEHERMTACAQTILKRLELPFRTMILCAGDMGFSAEKTYDLEVWLPGQDAYREISSCSNCGDFQARRMNARYRDADTNKARFVHTLNGSGLAIGRTLVAILENYQDEQGAVAVPSALQPYMGGLTSIALEAS